MVKVKNINLIFGLESLVCLILGMVFYYIESNPVF